MALRKSHTARVIDRLAPLADYHHSLSVSLERDRTGGANLPETEGWLRAGNPRRGRRRTALLVDGHDWMSRHEKRRAV